LGIIRGLVRNITRKRSVIKEEKKAMNAKDKDLETKI